MPDIINMNDGASLLNKKSRSYTAFKEAVTEIRRVKIRPRMRAWERMSYAHLLRIVENGYGTELGMRFSFSVVVIKGRNLESLGDALDRQSCDVIYEFDSDVWDPPTDPKAPFVESIIILTETREENVAASERMVADMSKAPSPPGS
jgi:hypothetical protein